MIMNNDMNDKVTYKLNNNELNDKLKLYTIKIY